MNSWPAPVPTVWRTWSSPTGPNSPRRSGIRPVHVCWIYSGLQYQQSKSIYAAVTFTTCNLSLFNFDAEMISCIKILHFSGIILVLIYILICLVYSLLTWRPDTTESNSMRDSDADESQVNFEIIRKSFIDHTQSFKSFAQSIKSLLMYVLSSIFSGRCLYGQQSRQSSLNKGGQ